MSNLAMSSLNVPWSSTRHESLAMGLLDPLLSPVISYGHIRLIKMKRKKVLSNKL
jgi:hypothetical protein